jgi:hypothetical protein
LISDKPVAEDASCITTVGASVTKWVAIDQLLFGILRKTLGRILDVILSLLLSNGSECPTAVAEPLAGHGVDGVKMLGVRRCDSPVKLTVGLTNAEVVAVARTAAFRTNAGVLLEGGQALSKSCVNDFRWQQESSELLGKQIRDRTVAGSKGVLRIRVKSRVLIIVLFPRLHALTVLLSVLVALSMLCCPSSKALSVITTATISVTRRLLTTLTRARGGVVLVKSDGLSDDRKC